MKALLPQWVWSVVWACRESWDLFPTTLRRLAQCFSDHPRPLHSSSLTTEPSSGASLEMYLVGVKSVEISRSQHASQGKRASSWHGSDSC